MINKLNEFIENHKYISMYCDNDTSRFFFGKILAIDGNHVCFNMISPDGTFDGLLVKKIESIFRIDSDGQYEKAMHKLIIEQDAICELKFDTNDIINSTLSLSLDKRLIVSIELNNSGTEDIVGFVENIDDNKCIIFKIDEYGEEDGISYVILDSISQLVIDSNTEKRRYTLWSCNNL